MWEEVKTIAQGEGWSIDEREFGIITITFTRTMFQASPNAVSVTLPLGFAKEMSAQKKAIREAFERSAEIEEQKKAARREKTAERVEHLLETAKEIGFGKEKKAAPVHYLYRSERGMRCDYFACDTDAQHGTHLQTTRKQDVTCPACREALGLP